MSDQNQASESQRRACLLCGREDTNQDTYGREALNTHICVHEFCVMFAQVIFREEFHGVEGLVVSYAELMCAIRRQNIRSFCAEHRPQQATVAAPAEDAECLICLDNMNSSTSYHTLVCPACMHAWFHRACIQRCALSAGSTAFRCPSCQNSSEFCSEMGTLGIQIPERRPLWEYDGIAELLERHNRCDAIVCLHPGGRHQAEVEG
ncbi:UNVERIFIED_CONTAM: hypothetical protein H355_002467 [Colinus virginianus]|nr:hypothetical protein H355_002467 [Colinus virginianus]